MGKEKQRTLRRQSKTSGKYKRKPLHKNQDSDYRRNPQYLILRPRTISPWLGIPLNPFSVFHVSGILAVDSIFRKFQFSFSCGIESFDFLPVS